MFTPPSPIDLLYDYIPLLMQENLCHLPNPSLGSEVAIVGAGAAGLIAAYELLKIGIKPIIYEASHRIGGRLYTQYFETIHDSARPFAEMGAMRIPKSSRIFFHYLNQLKIMDLIPFSGPGSADTGLYYKNQFYLWKAQHEPPTPFHEIKSLWNTFNEYEVHQIFAAWEKNDLSQVRLLWQAHIDQFKDKSFYEVMKEISPIKDAEQLHAFGSLGFGAGGLSPLFHTSFLEILRLSLNCYFNDLFMLPQGVSHFAERLYHASTLHGSLANLNSIRLETSVIALDYNIKTNNPIVITKDKHHVVEKKEYRAVIFTGSIAAAQLINITNKTQNGFYLFNDNVCDAIRNTTVFPSSKTYICTKTKFWLNQTIPKCIFTDELPRMIYFMDYPQTSYGVVCLSYTWGTDALKLQAVDPKDRVLIFKKVIESFSPEINQYLEPVNNEIISRDWVNEKYQNGAFNVFIPGSDTRQKDLYFQFQSVLTPEDKGIYLAGDSVSWSAGWVEGALYTGINAVYAVAKRLGAQIPAGNPLEQDQNLFQY